MLNINMKKNSKKVPQKTKKIQIPYIKIIYIGFSLVLVFGFLFIFDRPIMRQAVEGMSIARSLYMQSTVALPSINGAVAYNIYYKPAPDKTFTHSVRKIPATVRFYTISYLKRGESYEYQISAVNYQGREFWFSPVEKITNVTPM
jgi:hypothetical protein